MTAEVSEVLEVRIDCSVLMLADAVGDWPAFPVFLHLYVRDVDASYRRAIELGATPVQEPRQQEGDPDRHGGSGGQHLVDLDPARPRGAVGVLTPRGRPPARLPQPVSGGYLSADRAVP